MDATILRKAEITSTLTKTKRETESKSLFPPWALMCSTTENQSEKSENETQAAACVIFWAHVSIFWFRADVKMDFIFVQNLRQMLFVSINSLEQHPVLTHNSQVKYNKHVKMHLFL